ncbi:MAG: pyrimidine utilization protein D [Janthinobacterium lividum]
MHYTLHASQHASAGTVVLSPGLGGAAAFWAPQLAALSAHFQVLTYDHLGTNGSPAALPDDYRIEDMAAEVLLLLDSLGLERIAFMGHALGGLVGLQMALERPALIDRLVVVNGWCEPDSHSARCFAVRRDLLRNSGASAYVRAQPIFLYPAPWLSANAERLAREEEHAIATFAGTPNTLARIGALLAFDIHDRLAEVSAQTLVMATRDDILVPYTRSEQLIAGLPHAELVLFDFGGHGFSVTEAAAFNDTALEFLQRTPRTAAGDFGQGQAPV